jgi:hypothetical protein
MRGVFFFKSCKGRNKKQKGEVFSKKDSMWRIQELSPSNQHTFFTRINGNIDVSLISNAIALLLKYPQNA